MYLEDCGDWHDWARIEARNLRTDSSFVPRLKQQKTFDSTGM